MNDLSTVHPLLRFLWFSGAFWHSKTNPVLNQDDVPNIAIDSPECRDACKFAAYMGGAMYESLVLDEHGRLPAIDEAAEEVGDGLYGPAMSRLIKIPRPCSVPDIAPPSEAAWQSDDMYSLSLESMISRERDAPDDTALGSGSWKGCSLNDEWHVCLVRVNMDGIGSHLRPIFIEVLREVQKSYAALGLLFLFVDSDKKDLLTGQQREGTVNITFSFVRRSSGWIGLAIVGNRQPCGSTIWCRYLATYRGGDDVKRQWITLIKHELGHNCGLRHSRGGVLNPYIITGLPYEWPDSDPSTNQLRTWFSGVAIPIPGSGPTPDPPSDVQRATGTMTTVDGRARKFVQLTWFID